MPSQPPMPDFIADNSIATRQRVEHLFQSMLHRAFNQEL